MNFKDLSHSVKSVQIRSFFRPVFSCIQTEYREILRISLHLVRMWRNMDQENSVFGHFLHSDLDLEKLTDEILTMTITTSKSDISSNQALGCKNFNIFIIV